MIYVTHDQVEAMTLADRIVVLDAGEVRQFGSPLELYQHPDNKFVAGFIGSPKMNFLPCDIVHGGRDGAVIRVHGGDAIATTCRTNGHLDSSSYTVGVRPEHLSADGAGDGRIAGKVVTTEQLGAESWIYLDIGQPDLLVVKAGADHKAQPGEDLSVGVPAGACYLFDCRRPRDAAPALSTESRAPLASVHGGCTMRSLVATAASRHRRHGLRCPASLGRAGLDLLRRAAGGAGALPRRCPGLGHQERQHRPRRPGTRPAPTSATSFISISSSARTATSTSFRST